MDKPEFLTHVGDRVRIKDTVTHMYENARVYNEAIVKARTRDDLGYPHIYVEWDKEHWAYSGEEDGWTFEEHFDLVEKKMDDKQDLLAALADLVKNFSGDNEKVEGQDKTDDLYDQLLKTAFGEALRGDAFIVLVAVPAESDGSEILVPQIYMESKRDDAALMLGAAMADAAAQAHASLVLSLIEQAKDNGQTGS